MFLDTGEDQFKILGKLKINSNTPRIAYKTFVDPRGMEIGVSRRWSVIDL